MKKIFTSFGCILIIFLLLTAIPLTSYAKTSNPLDEIQSYEIKIDPRTDGTLDIHYTVVWRVLDDKSEGPLEWVKIGNPNDHVDEIVGISDNIDEIRSYAVGGDSYIRIDLDKKYYANEILTLEYTIHQSYMYIVEPDSHLLRYSFTAGWFPDINVKNIKVLWNAANVIEASTNRKENGYYIWEDSLNMDERYNVSIKYNADVFDYDLEQQYVEGSSMDAGDVILIIIVIIIAIIVIVGVISTLCDGYDGGYSGGGRTSVFVHSSCASSCACVSSCACACACAGGGRAGCTKKDFYNTKLKVEDLKEVLKK